MSSVASWKELQKQALKFTSSNIKRLHFEDGLLAIYKPYGIPVHSGPKVKVSISDLFPGIEQRYKLPAGSLELANRLDKNVAGVLLLTYKKEMAAKIAELYQQRLIKKGYLAILVGNTKHVSGVLKGELMEGSFRNQHKQTIKEDDGFTGMLPNENAETSFYILDNNMKSCMLCSFTTNTGYKHQLRVHASRLLKCPILGDHKYHTDKEIGPQQLPLRMMQLLRMEGVKSDERKSGKIRPWQRGLIPLHLFAQRVVIPGLHNGKDLKINAELPKYFRDTMENCELLLNREKVDARNQAYKNSLKFKKNIGPFVSKGLAPDFVTRETSL